MDSRIQDLIDGLELSPHPEGGYYREVFRSGRKVRLEGGIERCALTVIHFLLVHGQVSRWHRIRQEEVWTFSEGSPLEMFIADDDFESVTRINCRLGSGGERVVVVPAGRWQAARSAGCYTLVNCMVAPGFEFEDFELLSGNEFLVQKLKLRNPDLAMFI